MEEYPAYKVLDLNTWARASHFDYYQNKLPVSFFLTAKVDVTAVKAYADRSGRKFYGCFLYAAAKTVNQMDSMRIMIPPEGGVGVFEESHVNFTVFHKDDETFSDLWCAYDPEFDAFYNEWERVVSVYGNNKGVKGRPGQPANFFCISCIPWLNYTGYGTMAPGQPALFPIITFGKYEGEEDRLVLPLTLTIAHAACDGYHASMFFENLKKNIEESFTKC